MSCFLSFSNIFPVITKSSCVTYRTCIVDAVCYGQVTTINQETGIAGREPLETLATFRSGKVIRPNGKNKGAVSETEIQL